MKAKPAHLHQLTKVLPLQDHCKLIAPQYLAACFHPGHPGRKHLDRLPDPRPERGENFLIYKPTVQPYYEGIEPSDLVYKTTIKSLHTKAIHQTILSYPPNPNRVLGIPPPPINPVVLKLKRTTRSTLSQLRSGFSKKLKSYINILDPANPNECPDCLATPHDTTHLFECAQNPTDPTPQQPLDRPHPGSGISKIRHWYTLIQETQEATTTTTKWIIDGRRELFPCMGKTLRQLENECIQID